MRTKFSSQIIYRSPTPDNARSANVIFFPPLIGGTGGGSVPEELEEFEDEQGNVYNKKTYMDLKRQGLL